MMDERSMGADMALDEAGTLSAETDTVATGATAPSTSTLTAMRHHLSKLDPLLDARAQSQGDPPVKRGGDEEDAEEAEKTEKAEKAVEGQSANASAASARAESAVPMNSATGAHLSPISDVEQQRHMDTSTSTTASLRHVPTYLRPRMPLRDRLRHFTFAWYSLTLSTSSVALLLAITPHRFRGLNIIGLVLFLLDLVFFLFITLAITVRFVTHRHTFRRALTRPGEALFAPTFFLSMAAQLVSAREYGRLFWPDLATSSARQGLTRFLEVMFWLYLGATFAFSILQYHLLFVVKPARRLNVSAMTPAWILPIFPVLLAGTLASVVAADVGPRSGLAIASAGLAAQGLGFLVSVFMYATYLSRLMAFGLPGQRPGMFIAIGPPSFTSAALIALATDLVPRTLDPDLLGSIFGSDSPLDASALAALGAAIRFAGLASGVFLWALSFWFLVLAVVAVVAGGDRAFHLSWWSFIFPNVGFCIATIRFGTAFHNSGLLWFATVLTILLVMAWLYIFLRCINAVVRREILWPGHDEDS